MTNRVVLSLKGITVYGMYGTNPVGAGTGTIHACLLGNASFWVSHEINMAFFQRSNIRCHLEVLLHLQLISHSGAAEICVICFMVTSCCPSRLLWSCAALPLLTHAKV